MLPRVRWVSTADASCFSSAAAYAFRILFSLPRSAGAEEAGQGGVRERPGGREGVGAQVAALFWGFVKPPRKLRCEGLAREAAAAAAAWRRCVY